MPKDADHLLRGIYGDYMQLPDLSTVAPHASKLEFYDETSSQD